MTPHRASGRLAPPSRVRTLAIFGTVRIRELLVREGHPKPPMDDPGGILGLHHVSSGAVEFETVDGRRRFATGETFALTHDSRMPCKPRGDLRVLSVLVPVEVLDSVGSPAPGEVWTVPPGSALLEPALSFVGRAADVDPDALSGFGSYYFERLLQEMVVGVIVEGAHAAPPPHDPGLYGRAVAVIAAQRADPSLTPSAIARQIRISLRQLQRVFSARGTTAEREIRRSRVDHAVQLLGDPAYDALSVDRIGRYSGFAGGSSLARAMAAEGRESPARIRRSARGANIPRDPRAGRR